MILKKISNQLKGHLVDTTGVLVVSNPLFAIGENVITGMSDALSKANRINGSILFYLGAGYVFAKGRDLYHQILKIDKDSKYKKYYDIAWGAIFGFLFNGTVTAIKSQSLEDILAGCFAGALTGSITGFPSGYAIDTFRDLTDINPSERLLKKVRNLPSKIKKGIAIGLIVSSIGLIGGIYKATPENYKGIKRYFNKQVQESFDENKVYTKEPICSIISQPTP